MREGKNKTFRDKHETHTDVQNAHILYCKIIITETGTLQNFIFALLCFSLHLQLSVCRERYENDI